MDPVARDGQGGWHWGRVWPTGVYSGPSYAMRRPYILPILALAMISALAAPLPAARGQEVIESLTREEAVALALERNPAAVSARGDTRVAEAGVLEARGSAAFGHAGVGNAGGVGYAK